MNKRLFSCILIVALLLSLLSNAASAQSLPQSQAAVEAVQTPTQPGAEPELLGSLAGVPGGGTGWWHAVQDGIRLSEYEVTWQEQTALADLPAAYQAPNRAHNLRTYFTPARLRVVPRVFEGEAPPWEWGLGGFGEAAELAVDGNRVEYRYGAGGELSGAWAVNDEQGVETGFVLAGPAAERERTFRVEFSGSLTPRLADDGFSIVFMDADGQTVLHYGPFTVADGAGEPVPVDLALAGGALHIQLMAPVSQYPVTARGLVTSARQNAPDGLPGTPNWTAESDQVNAILGASVATAGDVNGDGYADVIIGAPSYDNGQQDEGRAFVYYGAAAGLSHVPGWVAESDQANAHFGSVAAAGDVNGDGYADVVVGAPQYDDGETDEGVVFAYYGSAAGLSAAPQWQVGSDQANAWLGQSVATAGDVNGDGYSDVIVGAYAYDNGQEDEGRVFVYHGSAAGLSADPAWLAEGDEVGAWFGFSAATAGDVNGDGYSDVIVGAQWYDGDLPDEGSAFVYLGSAAGLASLPAWTAEGNQPGSWFGMSVATAGDVNGDGYSDVVVGAAWYDHGQTDEGAAFVYHGSAAGLGAAPAWSVESDQDDAYLGWSVALAGDVNGDGYADVIVGASWYDNGQTDEGVAFVYRGSATGLAAVPDWTTESDQGGAHMGQSVAAAGDVNGDGYGDLVVGAHNYSNGESQEGAAFVYHGAADGLAAEAAWAAEGEQAGSELGSSVAAAGDVNGDGYADVIVGAPWYDTGGTHEGAAFVYHGSAAGLGADPVWTAAGDRPVAGFGFSVAAAGDVNGDGYSDVIVGAPYDDSLVHAGRAFVYHGSPTGLDGTPAWVVHGSTWHVNLGWCVATAGDVNGDGYGDVVVTAPAMESFPPRNSGVFVYHGSATGLATVPDWTLGYDQSGEVFGSVATAGDVNGDGYSDVVLGAWDDVLVYHGSPAGLASTPAWSEQGSGVGDSATTAGDVNGDGYSDVIVGLSNADIAWVLVYHGSTIGLAPDPAWTAEFSQPDTVFDWALGTAGDVNGDGYSDIIAGVYEYDHGEADEGAAFVHHGSAAGLDADPAWIGEGNQAGAYFGYSVAMAGDVNGDGYADVIVGAPLYNNGQTDEGRAFVYYGNGGDGLDVLPRQMRTDGSAPIDHLGASNARTAFQLSLIGRTPLGRSDVRLQWQAAPLGVPITATSVISGVSAWTDTGTGGAVIGENVTGLAPNTPYHWRVRLLYPPGNVLGQAAGRWIHVPWAGWNETDLRTLAGDANYPPVADAGPDQVLDMPPGITLDGSASYDPNEDYPLAYEWTQAGGPPVTFTPGLSITTFAAPGSPAVLTFTLTVTDSLGLPSAPDEVVVTIFDNQPPVADAGPDQDVDRLAAITLDGGGSTDPDGFYPLAYGWVQAGGSPVTFTHDVSLTTFTAPADPAVLTFTLTVTDSLGKPSAPDEVVIHVSNQAPVADAGPDQITDTLGVVTLDGSASFDPDGDDPLAYGWVQAGGLPVTLTHNLSVTTFAAPADPSVLTFTLMVTDSLGMPARAADEVVVTVTNQSPVADAGPDQVTDTLTQVTLDGSASFDVDDDYPLAYAWSQTGGPAVAFTPSLSVTTFMAPGDPAVLTFTLTVTDSLGMPAATADEVIVSVTNRPPLADAGQDQAVDTLALVTLDGSASADPDGDYPLAYSWAQTGGPAVAFTPTLSVTHLVAPDDPAVITFTLAVTDSLGVTAVVSDEVVVTVTNQPPVPDAGPDQLTDTLAPVVLDGSASFDPDEDYPLAYVWTQTGGLPVTFTPYLSVTAFAVPSDPGVLTFTLLVTDNLGLPATVQDEVVITVTNQPPLADAGPDQITNTLALVTLDGSASVDPDEDYPLAYRWFQVGGPSVLFTRYLSVTTFTAPEDPAVLTFTLAVTDSLGMSSAADEVVITVNNRPPVANAGLDQVVDTLALVTLDGSTSFDLDTDYPLAYTWTQIGGPLVTFASYLSVTAFHAPVSPAVLTFSLAVTDSLGMPSAPAEVVVTVQGYKVFLPLVTRR